MASDEKQGFNGACQPYKTRGGEWAVVGDREGDHYNGWLLPSELPSSWTLRGDDLDGQRQYDLVEVCRTGTPEEVRWRPTVERLLKKKEAK